MGKRVTVTLFDDYEPDVAAEVERTFSVNGTAYHLDLSLKNAERFDSDLDKWLEVATKVGSEKRSQKRSGAKNTFSGGEANLPLAEIRKWAEKNWTGEPVSSRGRVSAEVVRAWKVATGQTTATEPETPAEPEPAPAKKAPAKKVANPPFSDAKET